MPIFIRNRWLGLIFAVLAVAAAGFALRDAALSVYSRGNPSLALAISPSDPRVLPPLLDRSAFGGAGASEDEASEDEASEDEADEALLRDGLRAMPLSTRILRQLAASREAPPEPDRAARMMAISGQVSRRDLMTEVLLADAAARAGDPAKAIRHINAALSTNRGAGDLTFPFLVQLLAEPSFRPMIAEYVDQPWGDEFLYFAAQNGSAANALDVALRNPVAQREGRFARFRSELLAHLVREGEPALAFDYVRRLKGEDATILTDAGISNATTDTAFAPLSWALTNRDGLYADLAGGGGVVLLADPGARGVVLERVIQLAPGAWQLTAQNTPLQRLRDARAEWRFACASQTAAPALGTVPLGIGEEAGPVRARFTVPRSCQAVRVMLYLHNLDDQRPLELQLDDLALQRIEG